MKIFFAISLLVLLFFPISFGITGCGGGGGGGGTAPAPIPTTLSGKLDLGASVGRLEKQPFAKRGDRTAYASTNPFAGKDVIFHLFSGEREIFLRETTTDSVGNYTLTGVPASEKLRMEAVLKENINFKLETVIPKILANTQNSESLNLTTTAASLIYKENEKLPASEKKELDITSLKSSAITVTIAEKLLTVFEAAIAAPSSIITPITEAADVKNVLSTVVADIKSGVSIEDKTPPVINIYQISDGATYDVDSLPKSINIQFSDAVGRAKTESLSVKFNLGDNTLDLTQFKTNLSGTGVATSPVVFTLNSSAFDKTFISVYDTSTNATTSIVLGNRPDFIIPNNTRSELYLFDRTKEKFDILSVPTGNLSGSIDLGTKPYRAVLDSTTNKLYVSYEGKNFITVVDAAARSVVKTIQLSIAIELLAINPTARKIYFSNNNTIYILDLTTETVIANVSTEMELMTMNVIGSFGISLSIAGIKSGTGTTSKGPTLALINDSNVLDKTFSISSVPANIAISPDGTKLLLTKSDQGKVDIFTIANGNISPISVGNEPKIIKIDSSGNKYVMNSKSKSVSVLNNENAVVKTLTFKNTLLDETLIGNNLYVLEDIWEVDKNTAASLAITVKDLTGNTGSSTVNFTIKPSAGTIVNP